MDQQQGNYRRPESTFGSCRLILLGSFEKLRSQDFENFVLEHRRQCSTNSCISAKGRLLAQGCGAKLSGSESAEGGVWAHVPEGLGGTSLRHDRRGEARLGLLPAPFLESRSVLGSPRPRCRFGTCHPDGFRFPHSIEQLLMVPKFDS